MYSVSAYFNLENNFRHAISRHGDYPVTFRMLKGISVTRCSAARSSYALV